jgi:hypothetical protein
MDQPLKSPLLATDVGCRFACWGVVICLFILTMPQSVEPLPMNHWRLVALIGLELICIAIMWQFKHVSAARDVIDLQIFEVFFFCTLLALYFSRYAWYTRMSAEFAKPFFTWVIMMQLARLLWIIPNHSGSAYIDWPRFGLLGWFGKSSQDGPRPGPGTKVVVFLLAAGGAVLANWLASCRWPWPEYLMAGSGLAVIGIYARSMNNRVSKTIEHNIQTVAQIHFYQKMMNEAADYIEQLKTWLPPEVLASMHIPAKPAPAPASHLKLVHKRGQSESE